MIDVWERKRNFGNDIAKKKKTKKKKIMAIELPKLKDEKKKKRKLNYGKSNSLATNYFTIFYKLLLWPIFYWFSSRPTNNIIFLFINNHSSHQQFMKVFIKKFVSLAFCQKLRIKKKKKFEVTERSKTSYMNFFTFFY